MIPYNIYIYIYTHTPTKHSLDMFRLLIVALHVRCVSKCAIKLLDPLGRSVELMVVESSASSELQGGTGRNSGVVPRSEHVHVENSELGHLSVKF